LLRGAIVGAGHVALRGHVPGWLERPDVAILAVADPRPAGRAAAEGLLPGVRTYAEASELIEHETLDFVDVCTPPSSHAPIAEEALRAGFHVLCEKPLTVEPDSVARLARAAAASARALVTVHNWRYAPVLSAIDRIVRDGSLGAIRRCRWETRRTRPAASAGDDGGNWRVDPAISGGGILVDHGWHALYMLHGWLHAGAVEVRASLTTRRHREWPLEDTAEVRLDYPDASAEIFLTWAADSRENEIVIEGDRGTLRMRGSEIEILRDGTPPGGGRGTLTFPSSLADGSQHPEWFGGTVAEFLGEIHDPDRRGRNLAEADFCARAIAAARASSAAGGGVIRLSGAGSGGERD
jgi:predicted dehydrogenase